MPDLSNLAKSSTPSTHRPGAGRSGRHAAVLVTVLAAVALGGCSVGGTRPAPATSTSGATASVPTASATHADRATPSPSATRAAAPGPDSTASADPAGTNPTGRTADAAVTVTSVGWNPATAALEVSAYVDVLQTDGTCTLVVTGPGGATWRASSPAQPDASTTSCGLMSVSQDHLTPGSWTGAVEYSSPQTSGQVAFGPIEVP